MEHAPIRAAAILDLDGTLVDLHLGSDQVRDELRALFAPLGYDEEFRPLLGTIERICQEIAANDPPRGEALRRQAWDLISAEEIRSANERATLRPGALEFLDQLGSMPLAVWSNNTRSAVVRALEATGIGTARFAAIVARDDIYPIKPAAEPLQKIATTFGSAINRVYVLGDHVVDMQSVELARSNVTSIEWVALGLVNERFTSAELEKAGADFVVRTLNEATTLIGAPRYDLAVSVVLLAFNEEALIGQAIRDVRRFARLYLTDYEIVTVDDGSRDQTSHEIMKADERDVTLIAHPTNMGMGTAMRNGYHQARCAFIAHLPGDRQVRPQSLIQLLPRADRQTIPLTHYSAPPSGQKRDWMSRVFRFLVHSIGDMRVNFAGTYLFHRDWLNTIDRPSTQSASFLYSFQLLEQFRRAGAQFSRVDIQPFRREVGASREATLRRIVRMFVEILRANPRWARRIG